MTPGRLSAAAVAITALATATTPVQARDQVQITGSSTVLPYATIVAESFGENFDFPSPVVEGGGSGAGRKKLCDGVGETTVDIANSSSRITRNDIDQCMANGVDAIIEVRFGYDGIVFASAASGQAFDFTPADLYAALARTVARDDALVANPFTDWHQVNPAFKAQPILMYIPGTKHGTREVFDTKVILEGCKATGAYALFLARAPGETEADRAAVAARSCIALRTDGRAVDIDGDYNETLSRVEADRNGVGVFGLSFYQNNTAKLRVATIDGVVPTVDSIAAGGYPVSRPLYFYVKSAHLGVIPGLKEFVEFFVSDDIAGPDGPLADYGLVSDPDLAATQAMVADEIPMGPLD